MTTRKIMNFLLSGLLGVAAGAVGAYSITHKSTGDELRNIRWISGIAASIGISAFAGSYRYLSKRDVTKNDINKAVLNELRLKLSDPNLSPSDRLNLEPVIALYASTVEAQSMTQQTTLYQLFE